jgi:hypothetical protein
LMTERREGKARLSHAAEYIKAWFRSCTRGTLRRLSASLRNCPQAY